MLARALKRIPGPAWFVTVFVAICAYYEYGRILHLHPLSLHLWRQADCLSLTANYAEGRATLLEPVIFARMADHGESGLSAGEFPILYWLVGQVWKITGPSEFTYRLFGLLLHFAGSMALFLALRRVLRSQFWASGIALLLFTSPVVAYYGVSFITDVPSLDLALITWYFVVRYSQEHRRRWWLIAMCFFSLGTLIKVTSAMSLVALIGAYVLVLLLPAGKTWRALLPRPRFVLVTAFTAMLPVLAWYAHAKQFNLVHQGGYTHNSVNPLWKMTDAEMEGALEYARSMLFHQILSNSAWAITLVAFAVLLVKAKQLPMPLLAFLALLLAGTVAYCLLWFLAVLGHDYYFINPLVLPIALLAACAWWLRERRPDLFHARWLRIIAALFLGYNVCYAATNLGMRTNPHESDAYFDNADFFANAEERRFFKDMRHNPVAALQGVPHDLLPPGAVVAVPDDETTNGALYALDRPGFTGYGWDGFNLGMLERWRSLGLTHLVLLEPGAMTQEWLRPYLAHPCGAYKDARCFDLRPLSRVPKVDLIFDASTGTLFDGEWRIDTVACGAAVGTWCLKPGMEVFGAYRLPLATDSADFAEVDVVGRAEWDAGDPGGSTLIFYQETKQGERFYEQFALPDGHFSFTFRLDPKRSDHYNKITLENLSGGICRLELERMDVRRFTAVR